MLPGNDNRNAAEGFIAVRSGSCLLGAALVLMGCAEQDDSLLTTLSSSVIYGADDRAEPYEYGDAERVTLATTAVAALVSAQDVDGSDPSALVLDTGTLGISESLCSSERFFDQPVVAFCSGTLIASDLMLTAGHCIPEQDDCSLTAFVFDYYLESSGELHPITAQSVYRCIDLVTRQRDGFMDYAVVRLDRPVHGRVPAVVSIEPSPIELGSPVWVAGFPSGLPMKIADDAVVLDSRPNYLDYFVAGLDTFAGNSGSAVFDESNTVVGVLGSGVQDYVEQGACNVANVCTEASCPGEKISYAFRPFAELCELGVAAPFCACGDGECTVEEGSRCCADCGCPEEQICGGDGCEVDACESATRIEPVDALIEGDLSLADDAFMPLAGCSSGNGRDESYLLQLADPVHLEMTARGEDPVLSLYRASDCRTLPPVACDDDGAEDYNSHVSVDLDPGEYLIVVDSYDAGEEGAFSLEIDFDAVDGLGGSGGVGGGGTSALGGASGIDEAGGSATAGTSGATSDGMPGIAAGGASVVVGGGSSRVAGSAGASGSEGDVAGVLAGASPGAAGVSSHAGREQKAGSTNHGASEGGTEDTISPLPPSGAAGSSNSRESGDSTASDGCGCRFPARDSQGRGWMLGLLALALGRRRLRSLRSLNSERRA